MASVRESTNFKEAAGLYFLEILNTDLDDFSEKLNDQKYYNLLVRIEFLGKTVKDPGVKDQILNKSKEDDDQVLVKL